LPTSSDRGGDYTASANKSPRSTARAFLLGSGGVWFQSNHILSMELALKNVRKKKSEERL
jgi:hypothetical protein